MRVPLGTYDHLRVLAHSDALSLDNLHIVQPTQDLVLDLERSNHGKLGTFLDLEGLVLERVLTARLLEVDGDGRAARRFQG